MLMSTARKPTVAVQRWLAVGLVGCGLLLPLWALSAADGPSPRIQAALDNARNSSLPEMERLAAVRRLGTASFPHAGHALLQLVSTDRSEPVRVAAVRAFEEMDDARVVAPLLAGWTNLNAVLRQQALQTLTHRRVLAGAFVAELERGAIPLGDVDTATRQRLAALGDDELATRARRVFERQPLLDARAALERFRPALALKGDAARGKEVFLTRSCVNCHRIGNEGHFVGADLFTIKDMARDELLQQIVAPNLFFMPTFQAFVAETAEGEIIEGVVAGTTETTVTVRQALGVDRVFTKSKLKRLKGLNVSLMPEGLLEGLEPQQVADLLDFIRSLRGF
jgi:putative heme-binding domain-containing protein